MSLEIQLNTVNQLAQTRQMIAQHLAQQNHDDATTGSTIPRSTSMTIPMVFADLILISMAEKLSGQRIPLRQPIRDLVTLKHIHALLHATAQTHPVGLVIGAALVGAGVIVTRPWRWMTCSDVLPQLVEALFPTK
jgi:hypothetical protein